MTAEEFRSFSERQGRGPLIGRFTPEMLGRQLLSVINRFWRDGYFQQAFGKACVDSPTYGAVGEDREAFFLDRLGRTDIWPYPFDHDWRTPGTVRWDEDRMFVPAEHAATWDTDTLLDVIELLASQAAKPLKGHHHDYAECGMHYETFDAEAGRTEVRAALARPLARADPPLRFNDRGELELLQTDEVQRLMERALPQSSPTADVHDRVESAKHSFLDPRRTRTTRRQALNELGAVLELRRAKVKELSSEAENTLFRLLNKFDIRHLDGKQQSDYDDVIWMAWMFHVSLASIHAVERLIERESTAPEGTD